MVMKKFNLEVIYSLNLSTKVINDNFDITDDHEVQFFVECASKDELAHLPSNNITNTSFDNNGLDLNIGTSHFHNNEPNHQNESHFEKPQCSFAFEDYHEYEDEKNKFDDVVDERPLPNFQKSQKYRSFKPGIPETPLYKSKPMISKDYKKETDVKVGKIFDNKEALDLAIRLKALDEGYQFLNDRSAPESTLLYYTYNVLFQIRTLKNYLCLLLIINPAHLKGQYKGTNLIAMGLDGNNQIMAVTFGICKGETGPCWSWWMSVRKECIGDNTNLLFISDRHPAIALEKMKCLYWKICKAYTPEEFTSKMNILQDVQPNAYHKLCQCGTYVNACTVLKIKLPVTMLTETYRAMVQDWYFKRREVAANMRYEITDWEA
nr:transposase, MuDR, MULE transposase domain protein [Tanacetum cinerariifolium]